MRGKRRDEQEGRETGKWRNEGEGEDWKTREVEERRRKKRRRRK